MNFTPYIFNKNIYFNGVKLVCKKNNYLNILKFYYDNKQRISKFIKRSHSY